LLLPAVRLQLQQVQMQAQSYAQLHSLQAVTAAVSLTSLWQAQKTLQSLTMLLQQQAVS
jgi:hypothetical protein